MCIFESTVFSSIRNLPNILKSKVVWPISVQAWYSHGIPPHPSCTIPPASFHPCCALTHWISLNLPAHELKKRNDDKRAFP